MSQLILTEVGGNINDSVHLKTDPDLTVGPDDLLVEVEAAPINPGDLLFIAGWFGEQPKVPSALGAEGVGRVVRAGSATDQTLVGRRVLILPTFDQGTWADQVVVAARNVIAVGDQTDAAQLAMLGVNPATAHALLHDFVSLKPGDWIGVTLGNSGVGQNVIALAKDAGIRTLAVVRREEAAARLRTLGADLVLVDGDDLGDRIRTALGDARLRIVFDGIGGEKIGDLTPSLEFGGTVVTFSSVTGPPPILPLGDHIYREISLKSFYIVNWVRNTPPAKREATYTELAKLVARGVLNTSVEATYPLTQFQQALAHAGRGERTGKVLFTFNKTAD